MQSFFSLLLWVLIILLLAVCWGLGLAACFWAVGWLGSRAVLLAAGFLWAVCSAPLFYFGARAAARWLAAKNQPQDPWDSKPDPRESGQYDQNNPSKRVRKNQPMQNRPVCFSSVFVCLIWVILIAYALGKGDIKKALGALISLALAAKVVVQAYHTRCPKCKSWGALQPNPPGDFKKPPRQASFPLSRNTARERAAYPGSLMPAGQAANRKLKCKFCGYSQTAKTEPMP